VRSGYAGPQRGHRGQLQEIADLLEIRGDNPFRIRAYRNAARSTFDFANLPYGVGQVRRGWLERDNVLNQ
jgi:hypothetical protein